MTQKTLLQELLKKSGCKTQKELCKIIEEHERAFTRYKKEEVAISLPKFLEWCKKINIEIDFKSPE